MSASRDGSPPLYSLLYRSRATGPVTAEILNDIFLASTSWNARYRLTGLLLYSRLDAHTPGIFVQWIEGAEEDVRALFDVVSRDARHTDVETLHAGETATLLATDGRLFPDWAMRVELEKPGALPVTVDQFLAYWLSHTGSLGRETDRFQKQRRTGLA